MKQAAWLYVGDEKKPSLLLMAEIFHAFLVCVGI